MTIEALVPRIVATGFVLLCVISGAADQGLAESSGAALGRQGWEAIRAGQIKEASRLFHDAIAENAHDATLFLGAGLAAHLQGQEMKARTALQEAVRLNPKLTAAALLLGDITYRLGDLEMAVRTYEAALEVEPNNAQIWGRLESWRKEAALHRSEEHTSELQSLAYLVCRLLLEKKKEKLDRTDAFMNVTRLD